ncbi:MAG: hypothetical protein ACI9OJ_005006, partial [Myxococcota bacterium]
MVVQSASQHRKSRYAVIVMLMVGACGPSDSDETAADAGSDIGPIDAGPMPQPPTITEITPARGAWFAPDEPVMASARIGQTTGAIKRVLVNGEETTVLDGTVELEPTLRDGVNLLDFRAESVDGRRSVDGRAFFRGPVHGVGETLPNAVYVHLSPEFLDDDNPDQDDVAGVAETLLKDPDLLSLAIGVEIPTDFATITPQSISINAAAVDIVPADGALALELTLSQLAIGVDVVGSGSFAELISGPATLQSGEA